MEFFTYIAIYFIVWWVCLFVTLPFGVRGQHEDGEVTAGPEPGAPVNPYMLRKVLATTVLSAVVTLLIFWGLSNEALQAYWNR